MRFGRRVAVEEALAKKRVDDYRNVIYTVDQNESGAVHFSINYQDYFQPFLDTASGVTGRSQLLLVVELNTSKANSNGG